MKLDFELIIKLKFQDSIKVNGKLLYRAQEYPDWNTIDKTVDYLFYEKWNKKNAMLPKPQYVIRLFVQVEKEKGRDGWVKNKIQRYEKGELTNLETKKKENIKSVES
jgi:hypothetical protein